MRQQTIEALIKHFPQLYPVVIDHVPGNYDWSWRVEMKINSITGQTVLSVSNLYETRRPGYYDLKLQWHNTHFTRTSEVSLENLDAVLESTCENARNHLRHELKIWYP